MNALQQLLLLPLLAPLLAVLLVAAVNPRPAVALRLLIWTGPALPIGAWIAAAAAGGAALSGAASALALRQDMATPQPTAASSRRDAHRDAPQRDAPPRQAQRPAAPRSSGPSRPPGEPAPTVEVPFKVIRKGRSEPREEAVASAVGDGWDQPLNDDWD